MKKVLLVLFVLVMMASFACAQTQLNTLWAITAGSANYSWFTSFPTASPDLTRGMAYNPVTNHLIVPTRVFTPPAIMVLNALTGATVGSLDTSVTYGGAHAIAKVGVADDGVIYACNLVTAGSQFRIYKWASEGAVQTVLSDETITGVTNRFGDGFKVVGSGSNTRIYVSGSNNTTIRVYNNTGTLVTVATNTLVSFARQAIAPITPGGNMYVTGANTPLLYCDAAGNTLGSVDTSIALLGGACASYFTKGAKNYILTNDFSISNSTTKALVLDVTGGYASATVAYISGDTKLAGCTPATFANGTYEAAYNATNDILYFLTESNSIIAFQIPPTDVKDWYLMN